MSQPGDIQEKIAAARREAETLKEKIRAKRDQLADTSRECRPCQALRPLPPLPRPAAVMPVVGVGGRSQVSHARLRNALADLFVWQCGPWLPTLNRSRE